LEKVWGTACGFNFKTKIIFEDKYVCSKRTNYNFVIFFIFCNLLRKEEEKIDQMVQNRTRCGSKELSRIEKINLQSRVNL